MAEGAVAVEGDGHGIGAAHGHIDNGVVAVAVANPHALVGAVVAIGLVTVLSPAQGQAREGLAVAAVTVRRHLGALGGPTVEVALGIIHDSGVGSHVGTADGVAAAIGEVARAGGHSQALGLSRIVALVKNQAERGIAGTGQRVLVVGVTVDGLGGESGIGQSGAGEATQQFITAVPQVHVRRSVALVAHIDGVIIGGRGLRCIGGDGEGVVVDIPADVVGIGSQTGNVGGLMAIAAVVDDSVHQVGIERTGPLVPGVAVVKHLGIIHRGACPVAKGMVVVIVGTPQVQGRRHAAVVGQDVERVGVRRVGLNEVRHCVDSTAIAVVGHRHGVGAGDIGVEGGIGATGMISATGVKHLILIVGAGIEVHLS